MRHSGNQGSEYSGILRKSPKIFSQVLLENRGIPWYNKTMERGKPQNGNRQIRGAGSSTLKTESRHYPRQGLGNPATIRAGQGRCGGLETGSYTGHFRRLHREKQPHSSREAKNHTHDRRPCGRRIGGNENEKDGKHERHNRTPGARK